MMTTRTRGRQWAGLGSIAVVAVVGTLVLAACGGGSSKAKTTPTSASSAASSSTGNRQALQAYRTCLQQHGVTNFGFGRRRNGGAGADGATPGTGQPPVSRPPLSAADRAKLQAAQQACQGKLPAGFAQQRQQDLAAYRSCLRDHGVNVPATTDSTGGLGFGGQGALRNDPNFQAANKICAPLLPNGGFGRGGGGGDGGSGGTATNGGAPNAAAARTGSTV